MSRSFAAFLPTFMLPLLSMMWLGALFPAMTSHAAELPLTGPAYVYADDAYKAYARGDYSEAINKLREALRLRPDATQLRDFLKKAERARNALRPVRRGRAPSAARKSARASTTAASPDIAKAQNQTPDISTPIMPGKPEVAAAAKPDAAIATPAIATTDAESGKRAAFQLAAQAYQAFDGRNYSQAVVAARQAVQLAPDNREYRMLLVNALFEAAQYAEAEVVATTTLADFPETQKNASLLARRGSIRQRLGKDMAAKEDFAMALGIGNLPVATEIALLADLGRQSEARARYNRALDEGSFAAISDAEVAYLAVRVGDDENAFAGFNRADAAGKLANTAYQDAAFAAVRTHHEQQAVSYFRRSIDEADALRLRMEPQLRFDTRRAVADISREMGVIASLTYRGAVPGIGPVPESAEDTLQAGVEAYWRPLGYRNGRYLELFGRAFQTLHSKGNGLTGSDTLQSAAGIRYKPLSEINLVASFSRVFQPTGGRDDWLAQLGYSVDRGTDLRVDVPSWWTTRIFAEAGHYLSSGQNYALAHADAGRSMRMGEPDSKWVVFPHVSLAADYDSRAVKNKAVAVGMGPGLSLRYWFREDNYNAPRSTVDMTLQYRWRLSGPQSAQGIFVTTTLSY